MFASGTLEVGSHRINRLQVLKQKPGTERATTNLPEDTALSQIPIDTTLKPIPTCVTHSYIAR